MTPCDDIIPLSHHVSQNHPQMPLRDRAAARLKERPEATIKYFVPVERKAGGAYVSVSGVVRNISVSERLLVMEDGTAIPLDDIASIVC